MSQEESESRTLYPFKTIHRGDDTLGKDDEILFADFSPKVLPSDAPDEEEPIAPKAESVPEPAPSSESTENVEQKTSDNPAPTPADKEDGTNKSSENLKQSSSSNPKSG